MLARPQRANQTASRSSRHHPARQSHLRTNGGGDRIAALLAKLRTRITRTRIRVLPQRNERLATATHGDCSKDVAFRSPRFPPSSRFCELGALIPPRGRGSARPHCLAPPPPPPPP